jgi:MarC family integral membrane protein
MSPRPNGAFARRSRYGSADIAGGLIERRRNSDAVEISSRGLGNLLLSDSAMKAAFALGKTGIKVMTRVMALIVAAIGVNFIVTGTRSEFPGPGGSIKARLPIQNAPLFAC